SDLWRQGYKVTADISDVGIGDHAGDALVEQCGGEQSAQNQQYPRAALHSAAGLGGPAQQEVVSVFAARDLDRDFLLGGACQDLRSGGARRYRELVDPIGEF